MPTNRAIDAKLLLGSAIFLIGWGLAGLCPGPALVGVGFLSPLALAFVAAMAVGAQATRGLRVRATATLPRDA